MPPVPAAYPVRKRPAPRAGHPVPRDVRPQVQLPIGPLSLINLDVRQIRKQDPEAREITQ